MKKIIIITSALLSLITFSNLKAQTLLGGFENWDSVHTEMFTDYLPQKWISFNNQYCEMDGKDWAITKTTDARTGNYAVKIKNIETQFSQAGMFMTGTINGDGEFRNKIAVDKRYTKIEGYYKYATTIADTFSILVFMHKGEDIIGTAEFKKSANTTSFTKFSIPILYFGSASVIPDSTTVMFTAGSMNNVKEGSELIIDDVDFAPLNTGLNEANGFDAQVNLYPNPSSDVIYITADHVAQGDVKIELVNLIGQTLKTQTIKPIGQSIETSFTLTDMPKGILFVKVADSSGSKGFRIIHE